jgi:hypothetical protein
VKTYRITFERIGRNHSVAALDVTTDTINDLEMAIFRHARPHLASKGIDVEIDPHMTGGFVSCGGRNGGRFSLEQVVEPPVLDGNGNPVRVPAALDDVEMFRQFMAGRVPVSCGHYVAASEARVGFKTCERCPQTSEER